MAYNCAAVEELLKNSLKSRLEKRAREEDWAYLAEHPEIRTILRLFLRKVFEQRPKNINKFAADFAQCLRRKYAEKQEDVWDNEECLF